MLGIMRMAYLIVSIQKFLILEKMLPVASDLFSLFRILGASAQTQNLYINRNASNNPSNCKGHVNSQLCQGRPFLFKQTAAQDKSFSNVSWETHSQGATNPEDFLGKQTKYWSKLWNPNIADLVHRSAEELKQLRKAAVDQNLIDPMSQCLLGVSTGIL